MVTKSKKTKKNTKKSASKSFFSTEMRQTRIFIGFFFALFMAAVVYIDAGGLWGYLRNFFFGLFGLTAFVAPFFIGFVCIACAMGKDNKNFNARVIEGVVVFTLIVALCHVISTDENLTYGQQISEAYKVYKTDDPNGMQYGFGVYGALIGGIALMITGFNKLAAGLFVALILAALLMLFTGTSVLKLIESLRKPAEKVGEYAGEKMDEMKKSHENTAEKLNEKREKKAKAAERRRSKTTHQIELDIPIDDDAEFEDVGVEPIISDGKDDKPVELDDVIALFSDKLDDSRDKNDIFNDLNDTTDNISDREVSQLIDEEILNVDEETGEVIEDELAKAIEASSVIDEPVIQYELPSVELLNEPKRSSKASGGNELREKGETIVKTLQSFGVGTHIVEICQSPSVTRFELQPDPGVKISKITALADDIAMNLAASGVRIEAPIPNKNAVGIEVPNSEKAMVTLREIIETDTYKNAKSKINVALGRDIQGESTCADLAKMPHLLVAGTTGSGKSVCLNTMIMSLLYNAKPDEVKLIMIDPKKVEFTVYKAIPHLLIPVVSDPRKAAGALSWAVAEMDKRYALFADNGVRNLQGYNAFAATHNLPNMPQIVIIIDELSDLMMAASNEVEDSICRLAQKARAAGMHLIVATQRPSVDVITGLIKANIPSRIAFAVKSQIDSRTIIDTQGAEKLLGNGDMLYCPVGLSKPVRVQGCYVSDDEIERVISFVKSQGEVKYDDSVIQEIEIKAAQSGGKKKGSAEVEVTASSSASGYDDDMTPAAIEVVIESGMASTTLLQRKLKLGYARAARIVDELSEKGIIGPFEGAKPRKVLITKEQWYEMQANSSVSAPKQLSIDDISAPTNSVQAESVKESRTQEPNYFGSAVNSDTED